MRVTNLTAVFSSRADALRASETLLLGGSFTADQLVVSADLVMDGVAAEAPGQAYEFEPARTSERADAEWIADVERGGAVLTVTCSGAQLRRALELLEHCRPLVIRRR